MAEVHSGIQERDLGNLLLFLPGRYAVTFTEECRCCQPILQRLWLLCRVWLGVKWQHHGRRNASPTLQLLVDLDDIHARLVPLADLILHLELGIGIIITPLEENSSRPVRLLPIIRIRAVIQHINFSQPSHMRRVQLNCFDEPGKPPTCP